MSGVEKYAESLRRKIESLIEDGLVGRARVLVLDLDEMLVSSHTNMNILLEMELLSNPEFVHLRNRIMILDFYKADGTTIETMWSIKRPHTDEFLDWVNRSYDIVIVWSAGTRYYVDRVVVGLFDDSNHRHPDLVLAREDCYNNSGDLIKPLDHLYDKFPELSSLVHPEHMVLLDDKESNFDFNPERGLLIRAYEPHLSIAGIEKDDRLLLSARNCLQRRLVNWGV